MIEEFAAWKGILRQDKIVSGIVLLLYEKKNVSLRYCYAIS